MKSNSFFLLGAGDPEMREIERVLKALGLPYAYATVDGKPVHGGNMYAADVPSVPPGHTLVLVECALRQTVVDHHRPGDPGYGRPPAEYWVGSSLGQLLAMLGVEPTREQRVLAAMDHCYPAAFRGECPDVEPADILAMKIREIKRAPHINLSEEAVRTRIRHFQRVLEASGTVQIGAQSVRDLRECFCGVGYSLDYLTLQVAAMMDGEVVVFWCRDREDEPDNKWFLSGHATPETVVAFRDEWAPAHGLVGIHADPARGFALGYVPKKD